MQSVSNRGKPSRALPSLRRRIAAAAVVTFAACAATGVSAEICKYTDPEGTIHYSNMPPEKGWKRISCSEGTEDAPQKPRASSGGSTTTRSAPTPTNFPRVDATTQRGRDDVRRKVLMDELSTEEKLLDEARNSYAAGVKPLPEEKSGDEKYQQRLNKLKQVIAVHQKNVDALRKEIAGMK
jgi:hypothetical protein